MSIETNVRRPFLERNTAVRQYTTDRFRLLVSASGRTLLQEEPEVRRLFSEYRKDFEQRRDESGTTRKKLIKGNEGIVYTMGPKIAVKEYHVPFPQTHALMSVEKQETFLTDTLARTENLRAFCDEFAPDHIKVPKHYAFLSLSLEGTNNVKEGLLFMERVHGATMESLLQAREGTTPALRGQLEQDWQTDLKELSEWDFSRVDPRFSEGSLTPDLLPRNVIVDFSSPNNKRPYTLWLIDQ